MICIKCGLPSMFLKESVQYIPDKSPERVFIWYHCSLCGLVHYLPLQQKERRMTVWFKKKEPSERQKSWQRKKECLNESK